MGGDVVVVAEHLGGKLSDITFELLGLGKRLAGELGGTCSVALIGGSDSMAGELGAADLIWEVGGEELADFNPESWSAALDSVVSEAEPRVVLVGYTAMGMDLGTGLASRRGIPHASSCLEVRGGERITAVSQLYGGKLNLTTDLGAGPSVASVLAGAAPADEGRGGGSPERRTLAAPQTPGRVRFLRWIEPPAGDVDITTQEILVAIGRGIGSKDDIEVAEELAEALGAAVAGSRPLIDAGWLPRNRQVGKSGLKVKPRLYLALGISGAPEHLEGMKDSATIVAVNTDKHAPIFGVAHYGLVADLFDVCEELTELVVDRPGLTGSMLTLPERIAFLLLAAICGALAFQGFARIVATVRRGAAAAPRTRLVRRFLTAALDVGLQRTVFKTRPWVSLFHAFIFFGFSFYVLVNVNDLAEAFIAGWTPIGRGAIAGLFNLAADLLSVLVLSGMILLLVRRFWKRPRSLTFNPEVLLHPKVAAGAVSRDSLVVGVFILLHVGARWLGTAFHLAERGHTDPWLPTAGLASLPLRGLSAGSLEIGVHLCWWLAMGLILLFLPYFPRSKHLHLMAAPINLALADEKPRGKLSGVAEPAKPGARTISELPWPLVLDSYACIMCNRCQDVCPAHAAGTPLSPAALEINKRYLLNERAASKTSGEAESALLDAAIGDRGVWSCTSCYACVEICPVGNAPMSDLIELRRGLVFDGKTPPELVEVLRSLDEKGNSFGASPRMRPRWTRPLDFKIPDARKQPVENLWFVGDFASYDPQCQEVSRRVAVILNGAGIEFGILYEGERSAGNDIRRVGEEGLFEALGESNAAILGECEFDRIFTTDPHTFNALKNEYGAFAGCGGHEVVHYSNLLAELLAGGRIPLAGALGGRATYHDPCYLGRYNGGFEAPRAVIRACGAELVEMPRNRERSFCCGAGGGRIWMVDEVETERPSENRIREALALGGVDYFVVACPKDLTMYRDAVKTSGNEGKIEVVDIADLVDRAMRTGAAAPVTGTKSDGVAA